MTGCIGSGTSRLSVGMTLILAVLLTPAAEAQPAAKIARIGYLHPNLGPGFHQHEAFRQGLRDLGYAEDRNLVIIFKDGEGKLERLPVLAAELVALKVDVIVAPDTRAALAAQRATRTIPVVTGGSIQTPQLVGKCLEQLRHALPNAGWIAVLWQPGTLGEGGEERRIVQDTELAARALGMRLQFVEARSPADFDRAFSDMTKAQADALVVLTSSMFTLERRRLVDLAAKHRLPAVYPWRDFVAVGGLMSCSADTTDTYRRAATSVAKILRGAKPGELPMEPPTKVELVVNLKTARALGVTIPPPVLARADQVVE